MSLTPPAPLADDHRVDAFTSGVDALDDWLKRRARANQTGGGSRTFVTCDGNAVVGYYALAAGAVSPTATTGRFRRNMPTPIPVVVLGRLAVDARYHGRGLGRGLFRDAGLRGVAAADVIGVRGLLVHAISAEAKAFYLALGLTESPLEPMTLMVTLADLRAVVSGSA